MDALWSLSVSLLQSHVRPMTYLGMADLTPHDTVVSESLDLHVAYINFGPLLVNHHMSHDVERHVVLLLIIRMTGIAREDVESTLPFKIQHLRLLRLGVPMHSLAESSRHRDALNPAKKPPTQTPP